MAQIAIVDTNTNEVVEIRQPGAVKDSRGAIVLGVDVGWAESGGPYRAVPVERNIVIPSDHKFVSEARSFDGAKVVITANTVALTTDEIATRDADEAQGENLASVLDMLEAILEALPPGQIPLAYRDQVDAFKARRLIEHARPTPPGQSLSAASVRGRRP